METNELVVQYQAAEKELLTLLEAVEGIEEGNLKAVEETIYRGMFQIGRKVMEGRMNTGKASAPVPARRAGKCGHDQKVGRISHKKADHPVWRGRVEESILSVPSGGRARRRRADPQVCPWKGPN